MFGFSYMVAGLFAGGFGFALLGETILGLLAIVFAIPFANVINGTFWSVSCQVIPILGFWAGCVTRNFFDGLRYRGGDWVAALGVLLLGTSSWVYYLKPLPEQLDVLGDATPSCFLLGTGMLAGMALYNLMLKYVTNLKVFVQLLATFVGTVVFLAFVIFLLDVVRLPLPAQIQPLAYILTENRAEETIRGGLRSGTMFAGYHGYMENFGEYLVMVFAMGYGLAVSSGVWTGFRVLGALGAVLGVLFSIPAAIKAVPIMLGLFLVIQLFVSDRGKRNWLLGGAVVTGVVLAFSWQALSGTYLAERLSHLGERWSSVQENFWTGETLSTLLGRKDLDTMWQNILPLAGLFGVGPVVIYTLNEVNTVFHNGFYQLWLNYGLVGLMVYLVIFCAMLWRAARARKSSNPDIRALANVLLGLLIVILAEQIKVSSFRLVPSVLGIWFLFGMTSALSRLAEATMVARLEEAPARVPTVEEKLGLRKPRGRRFARSGGGSRAEQPEDHQSARPPRYNGDSKTVSS